jgi:hypothetical protein
MREYIYLGSAPPDEECVQVERSGEYLAPMREEARKFKALMEKVHPVPEELEFLVGYSVKWEPHDFGSYAEVVAWYDTSDGDGQKWALEAEEQVPKTWED